MKGLISDENISSLQPHEVFVFGSNTAGRHGAGAAKVAHKRFGAIYGKGEGHMGQSYGIPTKGDKLEVLSLQRINYAVGRFLKYARENPTLQFLVTPIGCGLAGYKPKEIAPMFKGATLNVHLPQCFWNVLEPIEGNS